MSTGKPVPIVDVGSTTNRSLGVLPESAPTATNKKAAKEEAHGIGSEMGKTTVFVSTACTLVLYVFNETLNAWGTGGANSARNELAFDAAGQDEFVIPPGQMFCLVSSAPDITGAVSGPEVR